MGKRMDSSCTRHCVRRVWPLVQGVRIWGCHAVGQYGKYIQTYIIYICLFVSTSQASASSKNIFDDLPDLAPTAADYHDELEHYLATDIENVKHPLMWWYERRDRFPCLSRMARDYLSIPGKWRSFKSNLNLISSQLLLLMLSAYSARVAFCSPTSAIAFRFNPHVPVCVSALGAFWVW